MTVCMQGQAVSIRPYEISDAHDVYSAISESIVEMSAWMPWCHAGYSVHDAINWLMEQESSREKG
ncbi:MAG: hypothetical protein OEQ74_10015, partial [Gammaproteobacteria bacterium]|nr:hypothetical protein [Gammaproteobacteria bacterium]